METIMGMVRVFGVVICIFGIFTNANCFRITSCNSNKISSESQYEIGKKSIILYNDTSKIPIPNTGSVDVRIWCEASARIDKCVLEHKGVTEQEGDPYDEKCTAELPISCDDEENGKNKNKIS